MKLFQTVFALCVMVLFVGMLFPESAFCITLKEEEELSHEFMKVVRSHYRIIQDPAIADYVSQLGQKIVSVFPPQPFEYHFYVIKEDAYNAFAGPGGHVFINSGLFQAMEAEDELAGILSHEIAHASCRHISEKIERSSKIGLATLAGVAAGILLGAGGAGAAATNALTLGSMAAGQSLSLAYSRENERQADQVGLKYLFKAGYSHRGLLTILKKIREKQWFGSESIPTYLTTHPAVEERIAYIETQSDRAHAATRPKIENFRFQRAHTRLTAVYGNRDSALGKFEADVLAHPADPVAHYGYGLILARTGLREKAIPHFKRALAGKALDPYILRDLGVTYFLHGQYQEALKTLEGALSIAPADPEGLFFLGRTHMEMEHFEAASAAFETILEAHPDQKQIRHFLGEAYGKQKKLGDAHYHLGLYYKDKREFENARFHLKRALPYVTDPARKTEIEKMLKTIRGEERRQKDKEK